MKSGKLSNLTSWIGIATLGAVLVGCGSMPVKRYYTLVNRLDEPRPVPSEPICERSVVVTSVDALEPYDQDRLVFRTGTFELKNYNYRVWVAPPPELVRKLVQEKIERTNLFGAVDPYINAAVDHLLLTLQIKAIEERIEGKQHSARVAVAFQLKDPQTEETLWRHEFDESRNCEGDDIDSLMAVLSEIYNEQVDGMIASLGRYIATYDSCLRQQ